MSYFQDLSIARYLFEHTLKIMDRVGWPKGGGSYMMNGQELRYNKETFAKQELLYETVKKFNGAPNILEIGVYAGHSFFIMMLANHRATFDLVDPCSYGFEEQCVESIVNYFHKEDNVTLKKGRSNEILPTLDWFYDIIHIDGGHGMEDVLFDFKEAKRLSYEHTLIVVDDWDGVEPQLPKELKDTFDVLEVAKCGNPNAVIRFK